MRHRDRATGAPIDAGTGKTAHSEAAHNPVKRPLRGITRGCKRCCFIKLQNRVFTLQNGLPTAGRAAGLQGRFQKPSCDSMAAMEPTGAFTGFFSRASAGRCGELEAAKGDLGWGEASGA
ncbi:hypothetical protein KHC23_09095 [Ancylobacter dichloromethanicus]|uniref:hypothetical protein n=1 Tax=Ancylobacter dichloromethanicus TaxID=518825 RepID=UPI001BD1A482|nr:hypothetical protein [Ancylobacter dichloromethanicus]MBS7553807.1 hypothetical protein [Ancylobacter dichloromethanicus]